MIRLVKITFWEETKRDGVVGRAPQRPNCGLGQSSKVRGRSALKLLQALWKQGNGTRSGGVESEEEVLWPCLDAWDSLRLRTTSTQWNVPERYGPHGEFFFFLLKKEPLVLSELVRFGPSVPIEKVKAMCLDRSAHDD